MKRYAAVCLITILSFGLLVKQVYPNLTTGDSAEFVVNAATLGINHPAGYPLFSLIGKLFSLLPLGSLAFRVNLLSAAATSLSATMLVITLYQFGSLILVVVCGCLLPLGLITHGQSISAEVYTLNLFIFSVLIYLAQCFHLTKKRYLVWLLFFVWALGLLNHYLTLFVLPLLLWTISQVKSKMRTSIVVLLLFGIGVAGYCYLPIRAANSPPISWGEPDSASTFYHHLKRSAYHKLEFGLSVPLTDKLMYVLHFLRLNIKEYSLIVYIFGFLGMFTLLYERFEWGTVLLTEYLLLSLGLIFLLRFPYRIQDIYRVSVYYLPAFYLSLIFCFSGLNWLWKKLAVKNKARYVLVLIIVLPLINYWQKPDTRLNFLASNYITAMVMTVPQNSLIITEGDNETFGLFYFKAVAALRPDLQIFNLFEKALRTKSRIDSEQVVAYANQRNAPAGFSPNGLLYLEKSYLTNPFKYYSMNDFSKSYQHFDNFEREMMATFTLLKGINFLDARKSSRAIVELQNAGEIGAEFAWVNNHAGALFDQMRLRDKAVFHYRQSIKADPYYLEAYYNLGLSLNRQKDPSAQEVVKKYLELSNNIESEKPYREKVKNLLSN